MIEIELLIIILFIVIALAASYVLGRKRTLRRARLDYEYEMQLKEWEERRLAEQKKRALKNKLAQTTQVFGEHVPADSALRRHYQSHLCAILTALSPPRPTDSVLSRHYDAQIAGELEQCLCDASRAQRLLQDYEARRKTKVQQLPTSAGQFERESAAKTEKPEVINPCIPQDATLKRHFLGHLRSMVESLTGSRPTDSTLRRHYETLINTELDKCLADEEQVTTLLRNYQSYKKTLAQLAESVAPRVVEKPAVVQSAQEHRQKIPEDSMLRRHFITGLRTIIESNKPPRPTDSMLRRHYNTMIDMELKITLEQLGA